MCLRYQPKGYIKTRYAGHGFFSRKLPVAGAILDHAQDCRNTPRNPR
jgi:hypothetical protein